MANIPTILPAANSGTANTVVKIMRNVPLDDTYRDVLYFTSPAAQTSTLNSFTKYTYTDMSYQRVSNSISSPRGPYSCRIPVIADSVYDCNYMAFNNGTKWFYCFIKEINFINENNTEIIYTIDWFQTYMFDIEIQPCMVVREHPMTDTNFHSTTPEPVNVTWYNVKKVSDYFRTNPYIVLVATPSSAIDDLLNQPRIIGGIYSGLKYYATPLDNYEAINELINKLDWTSGGNPIVAIFMASAPPFVGTDVSFTEVSTLAEKAPTSINGYFYTNHKLLNYPYRYFELRSTNGNKIILRPELINSENVVFRVYNINSLTPSLVAIPAYNGSEDNFLFSVEYNETVQCAWSSNAFANYYSSTVITNGMANFANVLNTAASAAGGYATGGAKGAASSGGQWGMVSSSINQFGESLQQFFTANSFNGSISGSTNYSLGRIGFELYEYTANNENLQQIDEFFTMYGYATNLVKLPEMKNRESFNYVQLDNPIITGSVPVPGMERIKKMFSDGVRLWHTTDVGNYSLSNRPLKEVKNDG